MKRKILCGECVEEGYAVHLARLFASLSSVANLRVLLALGDDEVSTNHLADILELTPSEVQHCLKHLEEIGLVCGTSYGHVRLFRIHNSHLRNILFDRIPTLVP